MKNSLFLLLALGAVAYFLMNKKKKQYPAHWKEKGERPSDTMSTEEKKKFGIVQPEPSRGVDMVGESEDAAPDNTVTKSLPLDGDEVEPVKLPEVKVQPVRKIKEVKDSAPPRKVIDNELGMKIEAPKTGSPLTQVEIDKIVAKRPLKVIKKPEPTVPVKKPVRIIPTSTPRPVEPETIRSTRLIGRPPVIEKLPTKNELTVLRPQLPQELQVRGGRLQRPTSSFARSFSKLRF